MNTLQYITLAITAVTIAYGLIALAVWELDADKWKPSALAAFALTSLVLLNAAAYALRPCDVAPKYVPSQATYWTL